MTAEQKTYLSHLLLDPDTVNSRNIRIFGDLDFSERLMLGKMEKR